MVILILPRFLFSCCRLVAKSCPTLHDLMDCSTPGFPVLHYLLGFAQTHVHWVWFLNFLFFNSAILEGRSCSDQNEHDQKKKKRKRKRPGQWWDPFKRCLWNCQLFLLFKYIATRCCSCDTDWSQSKAFPELKDVWVNSGCFQCGLIPRILPLQNERLYKRLTFSKQ